MRLDLDRIAQNPERGWIDLELSRNGASETLDSDPSDPLSNGGKFIATRVEDEAMLVRFDSMALEISGLSKQLETTQESVDEVRMK